MSLGLIATRPAPVPSFDEVRASYVPSDAWLLDRHGVPLGSRRIRYDVRRLEWVPLGDVSPALVAALISGEDRRFWQHHGIDWRSVLGALRDQALQHRRRGASTLSMQVASLLGHHRAGSGLGALAGKIRQMRTARALEARWSKPQILEAYLNLLGYQGELQGIGAAALVMAGKTPSGLTVPESMVLAALLPQPGASEPRIIRRACLRATSLATPVSCDAIRAAAQPMLSGNHRGAEAPAAENSLAPQLAARLLHTPGERLVTTLDASAQRLALETLQTHLAALRDHNVRDGAALVVDNASGEVLAYVGSAGPMSRAPAVDGVLAPRQAGSTLKPFLYEMALERRYLTAASLLADSPVSLQTASGVYIPKDYDHDFKGWVSVRTALAGSLNVPAVRTLVLVGVEPFRNRLYELGYTHIHQDGYYYGYSLALGSAEVTLWQQAQAYRTLARGGLWSPLSLLPPQHPADTRLLEADASYVIADILGDPAARAVTFGLDNHLATPFWTAVKTGTSEDMRDNWCAGFSRQFTVAVWVGNFEGDSMRDVSGVTGAAPVWRELMSVLQSGKLPTEPPPPPGVIQESTRFAPAVEPGRREWFLRGTETAGRPFAPVPDGVRPKIESPANGMIIAVDPDIPSGHQRVLISARGAGPGTRLLLNDTLLGPASSRQLWQPRPGAWYVTLQDARGREIDRILFTVRGP